MKGLFFEEARQRWRVRLYANHRVYYRAYFKDKPAAIAALNYYLPRKPAQPPPPAVTLEAKFQSFFNPLQNAMGHGEQNNAIYCTDFRD